MKTDSEPRSHGRMSDTDTSHTCLLRTVSRHCSPDLNSLRTRCGAAGSAAERELSTRSMTPLRTTFASGMSQAKGASINTGMLWSAHRHVDTHKSYGPHRHVDTQRSYGRWATHTGHSARQKGLGSCYRASVSGQLCQGSCVKAVVPRQLCQGTNLHTTQDVPFRKRLEETQTMYRAKASQPKSRIRAG